MNLLDALYACRNYAETPDTDDGHRVHLLRSIADVARAAIDSATAISPPDSRESLLAKFETLRGGGEGEEAMMKRALSRVEIVSGAEQRSQTLGWSEPRVIAWMALETFRRQILLDRVIWIEVAVFAWLLFTVRMLTEVWPRW